MAGAWRWAASAAARPPLQSTAALSPHARLPRPHASGTKRKRALRSPASGLFESLSLSGAARKLLLLRRVLGCAHQASNPVEERSVLGRVNRVGEGRLAGAAV